MDALSLKGFLLIAGSIGVVAGVVIGTCRALLGPVALYEFALISAGGVVIGLMVAGVCYLVQVIKDIQTLHLPAEELAPSETVLMQTPHSIVHYRTWGSFRFWEAVGGKLVLTSHRLVFIAHRGQPWCYRLALPLEEVARAEGEEAGDIPGTLRVITLGGKKEVFTFGVVRELDAGRWAAAILRARYRLNPELGAGSQT
jgi:hypothetical protein